MIWLCLNFLLLSHLVVAAPVDILFKRDATAKQREAAKLLLPATLTTEESIAELCYGVDLCASESSEADLVQQCNYNSESSKKYSQACKALAFRKAKQCSSTASKLSLSTLELVNRIQGDYNSTYNALISPLLLKRVEEVYQIDSKAMMKSKSLFDEFKKTHPDFEEELKSLYDDSPALGQYSMNCYSEMNSLLFANDTEKIARYFNLFKSTINTLDFLPPFKEPVNRGVELPAKVLEGHKIVGNVVCYKGFTSTAVHNPETDFSDHPSNSFLNNRCGQRLYINYESNGAVFGKLIDNISVNKGEDEVLFSPGACFRIDKVSPRTDIFVQSETEEENLDKTPCAEGARLNIEMTLVPSNSSP